MSLDLSSYREEKNAVEALALSWNTLVRRARMKDLNRCFFCGIQLYREITTKDHLWPKSKGGVATVLACAPCNRRKQAFTLQEFRLQFSPKFEFFAEKEMRNAGSILPDWIITMGWNETKVP